MLPPQTNTDHPKIGLALGAGGTRGAAHLGVLSILTAYGLRFDCIAGSSVGALYGACLATGASLDCVIAGLRDTPPLEIIDFYRRRLRIDSSTALGSRLHAAFHGKEVDALPTPFVAVAADLHTRQPHEIRRGELSLAVQASIAIPLLADPVPWGERYLVDGGFWENTPVAPARRLGAEIVIAVSLGDPVRAPRQLWPALKKAARWLREHAGPLDRRRQVAFILDTLSEPVRNKAIPDLLIRPVLHDLNPNSPYHMRVAFERGINAAKESLPALQRLLRG